MAYGQSGTAPAARARLQELLALRLDNLERTCGLKETQRKTIDLAGQGDIKRFFDAIDEKRRQMRTAPEGELNRLRNEMQASARSLDSAALDERSFVQKMVRRTLSADQLALYQSDRRQARAFRHQALVEATVGIFDLGVGLDDAQRRALTRLLLSETRLPKIAADKRAECIFVLGHAALMPDSKLGPIFRDVQRGPANRLIEKLREGLVAELRDFEAEEQRAATATGDHQADSGSIDHAAQ